MRKSNLLIFIVNFCFYLLAFNLEENLKFWEKEDFIGFDPVDAKFGPDLTTVFEKQIKDKNYIRLQFLDLNKLNNDFNNKALEFCAETKNFVELEKRFEIIDIDDTPAIGTETVVKIGIIGVVACK